MEGTLADRIRLAVQLKNSGASHSFTDDDLMQCAAALDRASARLAKRPVAWRVKDFADGWIIFQDEALAIKEVKATDAAIQGLYVRDGT